MLRDASMEAMSLVARIQPAGFKNTCHAHMGEVLAVVPPLSNTRLGRIRLRLRVKIS